MKKKERKAYKCICNKHGSAIITALVTMSVLILLGLAVVTMSMGTLVTNSADAATNDAYYAAEAGINSAIEHLKYETSKYYYAMLDAQGSEYNALYAAFFTTINGNAQLYFVEPSITGITTVTTFTAGDYDANQNICEFLISCSATAEDGTGYIVSGAVYIKRVDVSQGQNVWLDIDDAAIKAGGTLDLGKNNGTTVNDGNVIVADLILNDAGQCSVNGGYLLIDPNVGEAINDVLTYPSYSDPVLTDIDVYVTENDYTFNWGNIPGEPVCITTAEGIDIHFANCTVPEGVVYGKGDIHVNNGIFNADYYCDGDIHINNCTVNGDVYVRGDALINNSVVNGNIYCDGFVEIVNQFINGCVYSDGGIDINNASCSGSLFSTDQITIKNTGVTGSVIYSKTKVTMGNMSANAVIFSGGDIEISHSMSVTGCVIAKQDIYCQGNNRWMTVNYSQSNIEDIVSDTDLNFFFESTGESQLSENVFIDQSITAEGRIN
ncbi:MAG: hypothetical protein PHO15_04180 [Eubacteriales bacterium]|nr:hypothetical protein [Eubacteriales bacterium]